MAVSGIRRRALRTTLIVLSIAVMTAVLAVTSAAFLRFNSMKASDALLPRVIVTAPTNAKLPYAYAERIRQMPGAQWMWVLDTTWANDGKDLRWLVWAATDTLYEKMPKAMLSAPDEQMRAFRSERQGLLASPPLMRVWGKKVGDTVTFHSQHGDITGKLLGVLEGDYAIGQPLLAMHYEHLQQSAPEAKRNKAGFIVAGGGDLPSLKTLARTIDEAFANDPEPTLALPSWQAMDAARYRSMMLVPHLMRRITVLLVFVTMLVTSSTLAMSLRERRRDFGVLRALGYTRSKVFFLVLAETMAICATGALLGAGAPYLLYREDGLPLGNFIMSDVTVDARSMGLAIGVALLVAVIAVAWPAVETARLDVRATLGKA